MDKLEKKFVKGNVLKASEMNAIVDKINELIDGRVIIGTDEGTAYDGAAGATLEQLVRELAGASGAMYSVYVKNNLDTLSFSAQYNSACTLDFTFVSQYRDDISDPYKQTGELGMCTIMVKNTKYTDFTIVKQVEISSGMSVKVDVSEYLSSGSNSVKISVKGENTEKETSPVTYTIQLTSLGVSAPNFAWWNAYSDDFTIPMIISGNVSKILHVEITGDGYSMSYEKTLGLSVYTDTPYLFQVDHPHKTGIYNAKFWLSNTDSTIVTASVSINFMYVSVAGEEVIMLVINNVADELTNWQDNNVFDYAIYNGQSTTAEVAFYIKKENNIVYTQELTSASTSTKTTLTYPMEVDTDDDSDFAVTIEATSGDSVLMKPTELQVNNSLGFSATTGASLYMNPRTRSNSQSNYKSIVNEMDASEVAATWENFNFGNDGWTEDSDGVKTLRIMAKSRLTIDYQPFATECARTGKTIEIDYRVDNATDATQDIITMASNVNGSRVGLAISGENISLNSQSRSDSTTQDVPTDNGVRIRVSVVVMPDAYGNSGFNLVCIYVNGRKNRQFTYESNDYFKQDGKIVFGNDYANLYVYGMRVYDKALTSDAVQKNYINQLNSLDDKQSESDANDVLDIEGSSVDFEATKLLYNVFVCDAVFPSFTNHAGVKCNMWVYFKDRPHNNFSLTNLLMEGQGTSSKKYYEWNERWKFGSNKDSSGAKIATIATYADGTTDKNKVFFASGVPKSGRLTAKKNWASSMQDHKAGAVGAYTDLFREMGLSNEAMELDSDVRISVYQEPFIGFSKQTNEEGKDIYTCMGEFTLGPDKGDSLCFGYDTTKYPNLISVEGSDNAPLGALFRVPWNPNNRYWAYNTDEEAFQYNDTNCWDFDGGALSGDEPRSTKLWRDAYNAVYVCSNRIKPYDGTLTQLNAQASELRGSGYEYWIAKSGDENQYNLYYFEAADGVFKPSDIGDGTINLKMQLSEYLSGDLSVFSSDELNTMFINARAQLFRDTIPSIFSIDDAIFHYCFTEFIGGTDNRAKNTYPYNFGTDGALWRWRQDDLDTIFPIDNQGQDRKPYYVEMHDNYDNGQPMWNGETSVFWNMLENAYADEIVAGMKNMLKAMETLSGLASGTSYDKIYAFYTKYFVGVKEYFPATIINADAKRYEVAKLAYNNGSYTNDTDPITQSHGDFYSAETAWVKKRIMYIMSKYSYGLFSADGTDTIIVRAAGDLIDYDITPAFDMYPAIANGTSIVRGERTKAGDTLRMTIDLGGSADQQNIIEGASWLLSIGDWHDKSVSGTMVVRGKRLTELILGNKTETPVISITGLTISDCGSLQSILLSNISTLQGTLDLSNCENVMNVYADGTGISQIKLPTGGGLRHIEYPSTNKYIALSNFAVLTSDGVVIGDCAENVTDFFVVNCPLLNPIDLLYNIIKAQSGQTDHALKRIRAVGFTAIYSGSKGTNILDAIGGLVDGSYEGLDSDGYAGSESLPVLDGTLTIKSNVYEDTIEALRGTFTRLTINITGNYYFRFADAAVQAIIASKWGDGTGVTTEAIRKITSLNSVFQKNTSIKTFEELEYFEGLTNVNSQFYNSSIERLAIPQSVEKIGDYSMGDCPYLNYIRFAGVITFGTQPFKNSPLQTCIFSAEQKEIPTRTFASTTYSGKFEITDGIETIGDYVFAASKYTEISIPKSVRTIGSSFCETQSAVTTITIEDGDVPLTIGAYMLRYNGACTRLELPSRTAAIAANAFSNANGLKTLIIRATTPPILGGSTWAGNATIYVPDDVVADYKAAEYWSSIASRIKPMNELAE